MPVDLLNADITTFAVDAIVNAANERMLGGGGVDGAIHRAAGPELLGACRRVPEVRPGIRCPTGEARITPGFKLRPGLSFTRSVRCGRAALHAKTNFSSPAIATR